MTRTFSCCLLSHVLQKCVSVIACKEAYADSESEAACAVGCQGQLPAIAARHREVICSFEIIFIYFLSVGLVSISGTTV